MYDGAYGCGMCYELKEEDFYPPKDDRIHEFGIDDIDGGDTYDEYLEYFWDNYEKYIYD